MDRIRSMGVSPLNSVVCRRMATKLPMKLPYGVSLHETEVVSWCSHSTSCRNWRLKTVFLTPLQSCECPTSIGMTTWTPMSRSILAMAMSVAPGATVISYDGDLGDDSGDDENGA